MKKRALELEEDVQKSVFRKVLKILDDTENHKPQELPDMVQEVLKITKNVPSCP
jgi:hypothetical protein